MDAKVAIYDNHDKALAAVNKLKDADFPIKKVSIIGKADIVDNHLHIHSLEAVKNAPLAIGAVAGPVVGALTGLGIFAIPGFGFLYGAGAIIGALGGFDLGIAAGGILTLLATAGIQHDTAVRLEEHIRNGNFAVIVHGNAAEVSEAEKILHTEGTHLEIN